MKFDAYVLVKDVWAVRSKHGGYVIVARDDGRYKFFMQSGEVVRTNMIDAFKIAHEWGRVEMDQINNKQMSLDKLRKTWR